MKRILTVILTAVLVAGCASGTWPAFDRAMVGARSIPEPATQRTPEGAVALASYYVQALGPATATDDWHVVQQLADPSCGKCAEFVRALRAGLANMPAIQGVRIVVDSAVLLHHQVYLGSDFGVDVRYRSQAVVSTPGFPTEALPGNGEGDMFVWVRWRGDGWRVVALSAAT